MASALRPLSAEEIQNAYRPHLTKTDLALLDTYEAKCKSIAEYTKAVIYGRMTGLLLFGRGGTGKTYTVQNTLAAKSAAFVHHQGRVSARGLVDEMQESPGAIHYIEDAEPIFADKHFPGLFRQSLDSQDKGPFPRRLITWVTMRTKSKEPIRFHFTGGLIVIANRILENVAADIDAVKSRCPCVVLDVSEQEIITKMKQLCLQGFVSGEDRLAPDECFEVMHFVVGKLTAKQRDLDLRLLMSGFKFMLLWKDGHAENWRTLLEGQMTEKVVAGERRAIRIGREIELAARISRKDMPEKEKYVLFGQQAGKTGTGAKQAYLDRLRRAQEMGLFE